MLRSILRKKCIAKRLTLCVQLKREALALAALIPTPPVGGITLTRLALTRFPTPLDAV